MVIRPPSSILSASVLALLVLPMSAAQAIPPRKQTVKLEMADGVALGTDVYQRKGRGPYPTILVRTPYNKNTDTGQVTYAEDGYAVVIQDVRGRYSSEGDYDAFLSDGWGEAQDGYDTIEWIAAQSWSNGKVCITGSSARGITSYLAAGAVPPHLTCVWAEIGTGDLYPTAYEGGAYRQELISGWLYGLAEGDVVPMVQENYLYSDMWSSVHMPDRYTDVSIPIFGLAGWWDPFREGGLNMFTGVNGYGTENAEDHQWLVVGPWTHGANDTTEQGEFNYPPNSVYDDEVLEAKWFDYWLKGIDNGVLDEPRVRYYLMGAQGEQEAPGNIWKTASSWPVPATPTAYFLRSDGTLATSASTGSPLSYLYDPADPVPTNGGNNLLIPAGPYDQKALESRDDVLVFTGPVLSSPLEITGAVTARLFVSSDAIDTDFTVKMTDVYPDGRSMLVLDGVLRMRSREGSDREVFMTPGTVYEVEVELGSTAMVFNSGHQIRVAISSSNAARYLAHPNVADMFDHAGAIPAHQTLYVDSSRPSSLVLPVVK